MIVAAAGYTASFPVAAASSQPEPEPPEATTQAPDAEQGIIPEPYSGQAPTEAGDRGGALQLVVLVSIVAGVTVIATLVIRESRRNLGTRPPASSP
jgi:hypothetical protein